MRTPIALVAAASLGMLASAPALADCKQDIRTTTDAAAELPDTNRRAEVEKHLEQARSHLEMGHEEVCQQHADMAKAALDQKAAD